jgi:hypothetical protein
MELLSRAEASEQQSEKELLSMAAGRLREKRAMAGEQLSKGELPGPKYNHQSGEITTVEAVVGSLRIIQEDEWRYKVSSCTGDFHRLKDCPQFVRMDPKDRMALVERLKL